MTIKELQKNIKRIWEKSDNLKEWQTNIMEFYRVEQDYDWEYFKIVVERVTGYTF